VPPDVTGLIARFKGGSPSAYHALFAAFFPNVVANAGRHLGAAPPGMADAEDVALSAFFGLWREVATDRPLRDGLTDRDSLLRTLALLAAQKARRARRHNSRRKRDAARTVPAGGPAEGAPDLCEVLADCSPGPDARAMFREALEDALAPLTPLQRSIVELRLAGHTNAEIARRVGWSLRHVERQLSEVRSAWAERRLFGAAPEDRTSSGGP
jgi:RNA polymerase sigma factor (sigma-70 family)